MVLVQVEICSCADKRHFKVFLKETRPLSYDIKKSTKNGLKI